MIWKYIIICQFVLLQSQYSFAGTCEEDLALLGQEPTVVNSIAEQVRADIARAKSMKQMILDAITFPPELRAPMLIYHTKVPQLVAKSQQLLARERRKQSIQRLAPPRWTGLSKIFGRPPALLSESSNNQSSPVQLAHKLLTEEEGIPASLAHFLVERPEEAIQVADYLSTVGFNEVILADQKTQAMDQTNRQYLNETLFVVPYNDGESKRAAQILRAVKAPNVHISSQGWGATLDKEHLNLRQYANLKRVVVFEMPDVAEETKLRSQGLEVVVLDHHTYQGLDRRSPESSLEQLTNLIQWPKSKFDQAIAINDRGYIPGLKSMKLTEDQIRRIRQYDLMAQGRSRAEVETRVKEAQELIPKLEKREGVYIVNDVRADLGILKQELAIQSPDGKVSTLEINADRIGFSGNPEVVKRLLDIDFEKLGYPADSFAKYGGGDPNASMFFGFKPKVPPNRERALIPGVFPSGERALIPKTVLDEINSVVFSQKLK